MGCRLPTKLQSRWRYGQWDNLGTNAISGQFLSDPIAARKHTFDASYSRADERVSRLIAQPVQCVHTAVRAANPTGPDLAQRFVWQKFRTDRTNAFVIGHQQHRGHTSERT